MTCLHADATTATGRFHHHGIANGSGGFKGLVDVTQQTGAGRHGHPGAAGELARRVLRAEHL